MSSRANPFVATHSIDYSAVDPDSFFHFAKQLLKHIAKKSIEI